MNVQKISKSLFTFTLIFGLFFAVSVSAVTVTPSINPTTGQFSCTVSGIQFYSANDYTNGGASFNAFNSFPSGLCDGTTKYTFAKLGTPYIPRVVRPFISADGTGDEYGEFWCTYSPDWYCTWSSFISPYPHIEDLSYSTTTAKATITGYWEATTTPYITQRLTFWQFSDTLGEESREQLTATTTGAFSFTFDFKDPYAWSSGESSTTPIYTSFTLNASLDQYDETNYVFPYGGTIIDNLDATSTTLYASSYNASDFISTPRDLALYPEYDCDLVHLSGCLKNAAIWLFYPTQDALDSWTTLKTTLETKAPFGYFYSVKNAVGGLSATSTPSFSLTIPAHLKTYFFDPFDTGIAGILWFFFIFHFYKRLKHIQI